MKKNIKTTTKFILMMCHIVDEYETFNGNLNELLKKIILMKYLVN